MQDFRPPDDVENSGSAPRGHTPDVSAVERAAEVIAATKKAWGGDSPTIAQALADAGLLCSDAERAVLDAADEWCGEFINDPEKYPFLVPTVVTLVAAVRARREAKR